MRQATAQTGDVRQAVVARPYWASAARAPNLVASDDPFRQSVMDTRRCSATRHREGRHSQWGSARSSVHRVKPRTRFASFCGQSGQLLDINCCIHRLDYLGSTTKLDRTGGLTPPVRTRGDRAGHAAFRRPLIPSIQAPVPATAAAQETLFDDVDFSSIGRKDADPGRAADGTDCIGEKMFDRFRRALPSRLPRLRQPVEP